MNMNQNEAASPSIPMTNAVNLAFGGIPCETNPSTGALSRLSEPFHAPATETVGSRTPFRHVCRSCRDRHHHLQASRHGILWE
jgi:hypothetical protein